MKTEAEIQKVLDEIRPLVNQDDRTAEVIWDSLRWVTGEDPEDPVLRYGLRE